LKLTLNDIAGIIGGTLHGNPAVIVSEIVIDSRHLPYTDGVAFLAIRGKHHDGHSFIGSLHGMGIRVFIVERLPGDPGKYEDASFILTDNTLNALHLIAADIRRSFRSEVIAITGSAGKTVVKEWLADVLGLSLPVIRSPKSYNSQVGVPLSVMKLDNRYALGIFEAGISMPGEMDKLRCIICPDIGVITNIGDAHGENFKNNKAKAREKLRLFRDVSRVIYCRDDSLLRKLITNDRLLRKKEITDWSRSDHDAAMLVNAVSMPGGGSKLETTYRGKAREFFIPFNDHASVENAITVTATCLTLSVDPAIIRQGLAGLVPVAMRMEIKTGINDCQLIEDYYNSDPGSLGIALEYLYMQKEKPKTLILSDFIQSGRDEKELYGEVAHRIKKTGIDRLIGIGPSLARNAHLFDGNATFFQTTEEFLLKFNTCDFNNETILIKGARKYEFERIGKLLEHQVHQTILEINLDAIAANLNEFRKHLVPGTRIMVMVKAFAYGAGPAEIASFLEYHRVSYLGVAYTDEGVELRSAGVTLPVMVMNPDISSYETMIRYNLEPSIYSFLSLEKFLEAASRHGLVHYPVHIKIDTGMHRLGFMPDEIALLRGNLMKTEHLRVISVYSHFAASENPVLDDFTRRQAEVFIEAADMIGQMTGYKFTRHVCNSSAIERFPEYQFDMVRLGIGLYGTGKFRNLTLEPAGRFSTRISQVKTIPAGEPVGYGCSDVSGSERVIAIIPVGYADGLSRRLGNRQGSLFIKNRRVPIIGNVCMDICMIDISGIDAQPGDEVEIFGKNITIEEIADKCGTIPYEILTSIPARVKRVFTREQ
jgi:alanine racemase